MARILLGRGFVILSAILTIVPLRGESADSVVVFNEIQYQPADEASQPEWIELHNMMGVTVDLSGWRVEGAGDLTFKEGTRIPGRGYLLLTTLPNDPLFAESPVYAQALTGRLSNDGETLRLINHSGRLMDRLRYRNRQGWPVGAAGSGATLSKRHERSAETGPENWMASPKIGGTPGRPNTPPEPTQPSVFPLIKEDAQWRYHNTGKVAPIGWSSLGFDHSDWPRGEAPFWAGDASERPGSEGVLAYWKLDEGEGKTATDGKSGREGRLVNGVDWVKDSERGWVLEFDGVDGYVDTGIKIPRMTLENDFTWAFWALSRKSSNVHVILGNRYRANGADFSPREFIKFTNGGLEFHRRGSGEDILYPPIPRNEWVHHALVKKGRSLTYYRNGSALGNQRLSSGLENPQPLYFGGDRNRENWRGRLDDVGLWKVALEASTIARLADGTHSPESAPSPGVERSPQGGTELSGVSLTAYFAAEFNVMGEPAELLMNLHVDDGGVVFLNGHEVHRFNVKDGPLQFGDLASDSVEVAVVNGPISISPRYLRAGRNVIAVEVHQAKSMIEAEDFDFGLTLDAREPPERSSNPGRVQFNEVGRGEEGRLVLEIANRDSVVRNLSGYEIRGSNHRSYRMDQGHQLAPGGFLVIDEEILDWKPRIGDRLFLLAPGGGTLLDAVALSDRLQGRLPEDPSRWFHPQEPSFGSENPPRAPSSIVINEIMYHPMGSTTGAAQAGQWIELMNQGESTVDLSHWRFDDGIDFTFPPGTRLEPGRYLLIVERHADFEAVYPDLRAVAGEWSGTLSRRGERLRLVDAGGHPVDELRFHDGGRWPIRPDGGGSSLELRDPRSDNRAPEAWAASATAGRWHQVSYEGRGVSPSTDPTRYQEFVLGLLDEGEFLIDDISVIEEPGGASRELIQNGDFESGLPEAWRSLGTHRRVEVIDDPDGLGNKVLRVVATGPTEHMSNHLETTLRFGGAYVRVSERRNYRISFRAKWMGGSNQLHSRLYFNRLARTTLLPVAHAGGSPGAANTAYRPNGGATFRELSHFPIVPEPREPVTVQVVAQDPDGIAGLTLLYSVRGGRFQRVVMQGSSQGWSGSIPGQELGAKIQFYVEALDGRGVRSWFPSEGEHSAALIPVSDGQADLDYGDCRPTNLRIVMKSNDIRRLHASENVMSNERLGCTIIVDERDVYYGAGIRLKGSEHGRASDLRVGYNIRFPADHRFLGAHETITVDRSGAGDQFSQREIMVKHAINHAGGIPGSYDDLIRVIAPRPQHTGSAMLSKSRFDREFLVHQFNNGNQGSLYEYELIYVLSSTMGGVEGLKVTQPGEVRGVGVRNLNSLDKERYRWHWLLKNNRDRDDFDPVIGMVSAMGLTGSRFRLETDRLLDVNQWLRAFAIQVLFGIADNYASGGQHNAMFYQRPADGKMLFLPWDMDFTFVRGATSDLTPNGDLDRLIAASGRNRRNYYRHLWEIIQTTFNPEYLGEWTKHYSCYLPHEDLTRFDSYIRQRQQFALGEINRNAPPLRFNITTPDQTRVNGPSINLTGSGWLDVDQLKVAGGGFVPLEWTGWNQWQGRVPVAPGLNRITLEALDRWGNSIGSDQVEILGTGTVRAASRDNVAISELMYHPEDPNDREQAAGWTDAESFEFIELVNLDPEFSIDLGGVAFTEGIDYILPSTLLGPGERAVLAGNLAAFQSRYGREIQVLGEYQNGSRNRLSNAGETLHLVDATGAPITAFEWSDSTPWPEEADGQGYSLVALRPGIDPPHAPHAWRSSADVRGNPAASDSMSVEAWIEAFQVTGMDVDEDSDGWTAAWEYVAGSDPGDPDDVPVIETQYDEGSNRLAVDIRVRVGRDDLQPRPRQSVDLIEWTDRMRFHERRRVDEGMAWIRYVSELPVSEAAAQYVRLDLDADGDPSLARHDREDALSR